MKKWNAKDRALAAMLAAPFAAVCVVVATSTEAGARLAERFDAAVAAASERWRERFGTEPEARAGETPKAPKISEAPVRAVEASKIPEAPVRAVETPKAPKIPETPIFPGTNDQWARGFDDRWLVDEKERRTFKPIADNSGVYAVGSQRPGHVYGNHAETEAALWAAETERLVVEGSLIFHDANLLGSGNGVSCDSCHPDAEGTHAETYPKYQVQLGRAALLRDMANWCLTQPCRGEPMSGDDPRMRALEAYMLSARAGKTMEYGKR